MAATTTGTKTVTKDAGPTHTAAKLTTLLATPLELMSIADFRVLEEALKKVSRGHDPTMTIGALLV